MKSDVYENTKELIAMIETLTGQSIKRIRSDNGGEYVSNSLQKLLAHKGIFHDFTVPNTPQQHGVAERSNRIIFEKERCMLYERKIPLKFRGRQCRLQCT